MPRLTPLRLAVLLNACAGAARHKRGKAGQQAKVSTLEPDCYSEYDGEALLKVTSCDEESALKAKEMIATYACVDLSEAELLPTPGHCVESSAICSPSALASLMDIFGSNVVVESDDAGNYMRAKSGVTVPSRNTRSLSPDFYSNWRNLADRDARVDACVAASNGAATIEVIGSSVEGRPIRAVRLRGKGYVNGNPKVLATFNIHAREWIAGMSGVYAVEKATAKAAADPSWLNGMELVLIPMVNPDGFHYSTVKERLWRKNRNPNQGDLCAGVDLNRNFPIDFGGRWGNSAFTCMEIYRGKAALSEPESKAIARAIEESKLSVLLDVHCYGQVLLRPWSCNNTNHPRFPEVNELGNRMLTALKRHRNNSYKYGGNELLGAASGILPDYALDGLGYTLELSTSFTPPTSDILPSAIETMAALEEAIRWAREKR